jgi:DNA-binding phage protein
MSKPNKTEKFVNVNDDIKSIRNNSADNDFETIDTGAFTAVDMSKEGNSFIGYIVGDISENRPEWLPEQFDDNAYEIEFLDGRKGIISKYHAISQAVNKVGIGKEHVYKFVRGTKKDDYVNFLCQSRKA